MQLMVYIQDCFLLIFTEMATLKYPRQSLVIFSFSFMVMFILSKVEKSERFLSYILLIKLQEMKQL